MASGQQYSGDARADLLADIGSAHLVATVVGTRDVNAITDIDISALYNRQAPASPPAFLHLSPAKSGKS